MENRIGFGYDVHRLEPGLPLRIGGITIPHSKGSLGHSDADVLIHALCDAILGAVAMGDIGTHFPVTDPEYKGINSIIILKKTIGLIQNEGYGIVNIDSTVCLQNPKIQPFIDDMRTALSKATGLDKNKISIKATTEERLGFTGSEQGISAYAVVLLFKQQEK